jgi:hypothetical protein
MNDLIKEYATSIEKIEAEMARCLPILESLKRKVGRQERRSISEVVQLITANKTLSTGSKDAVWDIYKELVKVEEAMRNLHKDKQWER